LVKTLLLIIVSGIKAQLKQFLGDELSIC